jgi:hypothetical protein
MSCSLLKEQQAAPSAGKMYRLVATIPNDASFGIFSTIGGCVQSIDVVQCHQSIIAGKEEKTTLILRLNSEQQVNVIRHVLEATDIRIINFDVIN